MSDLCRLIWCALIGLFRSQAALEAEILVLCHQLSKSPRRVTLQNVFVRSGMVLSIGDLAGAPASPAGRRTFGASAAGNITDRENGPVHRRPRRRLMKEGRSLRAATVELVSFGWPSTPALAAPGAWPRDWPFDIVQTKHERPRDRHNGRAVWRRWTSGSRPVGTALVRVVRDH
jgi:hypothetical protein